MSGMTKTQSGFFDGGAFDLHLCNVVRCGSRTGQYRVETHVQCELIYKLEGSSIQDFGDRTLELVPDSVYFIPAGTGNTFTVREPGDIINILFDLNPTGSGMKQLSSFQPEIIRLPAGNRYKGLFIRAAEAWMRRDRSSYPEAMSAVYEILAGIAEEREQQYVQQSKYALITPAIRYIRENFRSQISIGTLSELCGISDEYLRTLFCRFVGQPPHAYLNALRLDAARTMLLEGYASVAEIAAACGFENPGYFSRLFRKYYGCPPSRITWDTDISFYLQQKNRCPHN